MATATETSQLTSQSSRERHAAALPRGRFVARDMSQHAVPLFRSDKRLMLLGGARRRHVASFNTSDRAAAHSCDVSMSESSPQRPIEPLTHRNLDGVPYVRTPTVEQQIRTAIALETGDLLARADISDPADPRYLQEETLAYLIRRAHRAADDVVENRLAEVLVQRCTRFLTITLRRLPPVKFEEVIAETLADLFEKLVAASDAGDFLEVRFWVVVKRLGWAAAKRAFDELQRESLMISIEGTGPAVDDEDGRVKEIADDVRPPLDTRLLTYEALSLLEPRVREAFVLKLEGWPIEDQNPNVMTISRYFNKTSRTIRNWIADAEKQLAAWRDERAGQ